VFLFYTIVSIDPIRHSFPLGITRRQKEKAFLF
jgi:hypothetical protein